MPSTHKPLLPILVSLLLAGCESHRPTDQLAQAVATGERPVAMKGESTFFGGVLDVTVTVSAGIGHGISNKHRNRDTQMPDLTGEDNDEIKAYLRAKGNVGSAMPPVTIHLQIRNQGQHVYSVDVTDFESDLGNFAVNPEELAVAPSQVAEPDPMTSQLGVTSDTIPFTVTLKMADRQETHTITVQNLHVPGGKD